ncbi:hypothetical protein BDB01DRAFT_729023 [Pilobolus umbonatus]|nr:hypothetical protein BDB01DRAFT_729023 [Pilobolus umbonatus]
MQGRSFSPLIIYHDQSPKQLNPYLINRTAIDRHRDRTNEMMEHNAHFWTVKHGLVYEEDEIRVSPSTSTTSNLSSSSSTSGDSEVTIDTPSHIKNIRSSGDEQSAQKSMADPTKKRRRGNLPKEVTEFLRKWLIQHKKHPYPAEKEKIELAHQTGLTVNQISNWFINARRRILQPMLESENTSSLTIAYPESSAVYEGHSKRHDFYAYSHPRKEYPPASGNIKYLYIEYSITGLFAVFFC